MRRGVAAARIVAASYPSSKTSLRSLQHDLQSLLALTRWIEGSMKENSTWKMLREHGYRIYATMSSRQSDPLISKRIRICEYATEFVEISTTDYRLRIAITLPRRVVGRYY